MIKRVIYSSRSRGDITSKDVYEIIRVSHNRNSLNGLTGGLVFVDGYFYQLLEGLPTAVTTRLVKILADPRHHDVQVRNEVMVDEPLFADEWMALREGSQIEDAVFERAGYLPGMPADKFTAQQLEAFLLDCFGLGVASEGEWPSSGSQACRAGRPSEDRDPRRVAEDC